MQFAERFDRSFDIIEQRRARLLRATGAALGDGAKQSIQARRVRRCEFRMLTEQKFNDLLVIVQRLERAEGGPTKASSPKRDVTLREARPLAKKLDRS